MKTFKDEVGREYEAVPALRTEADHIIIRPIQPEPKWSVKQGDPGEIIIDTGLYFSYQADQAQLIKEAVEALMADVTGPSTETLRALNHARDAARAALEADNGRLSLVNSLGNRRNASYPYGYIGMADYR